MVTATPTDPKRGGTEAEGLGGRPRRAGRTAGWALAFLILGLAVQILTADMVPTTQAAALVPGLITGLALWAAIILFVVAAYQAVRNRMDR